MAVVAHIVVIGAVIWERTRYLEGAVGGAGPRGGGGRGGQEMNYIALAAPAEAKAAEAPKLVVREMPVPVAEPVKIPEPEVELAPVAIAPVAVAVTGAGESTGAPGQESGSGGGTGGGTGTGTGSQEGPGSGGGDGGDIIPPDPIGIFIPPSCVSGTIAVTFSIEATGRVSNVELNPPPKDASCRRELTDKLRLYRFKPARMRDGRPVAYKFPGWVGK